MSKIRAWLELARLSNLPTVWTNVLVGLYAGYTAGLVASGIPPARTGAALLLDVLNQGFVLLVAMSCLYTAGMVLNDVLDVEIDRQERPHRPIPSGRVSLRGARLMAVGLFAVGVLGLLAYRPLAVVLGLALATAIVAYDWSHARSPHAVLLMGLCRALVYLTAAAAVPIGDTSVWLRHILPIALCGGIYVVLITLIARLEAGPRLDGRRWLALLMMVIVLVPALFFGIAFQDAAWLLPALAALGVLLWLGWAACHALAIPPRTPQAVMAWLSGLCLIDAFYLTLLGQPWPAAVAAGCFVITAAGHRWLAGT